MTAIVLVHGAWHGGWCWRRVAQRLQAAGHEVYAPSLTGLGDRAHLLSPSISLTTHITDIVNIISSRDLENVVLCGHSYGGLVISAVADQLPERVAALVYLDALVPEHGQSMFDTIPVAIADGFRAQAAAGDGFSVPPMTAAQFNVYRADVDLMNSKCTPHPLASFAEPVQLTAQIPSRVRRLYVLAEGFEHPGTQAAYARVSGLREWQTQTMSGGHDLMLDNPSAVTQVLLDCSSTV